MSDLKKEIQRAKQVLPLPDLLRHYELGHFAKPSTKSPFREGDNPHAFGIFQNADGDWRWKDHVTKESGDEVDFVAAYENRSHEDAIIKYLEIAGVRQGVSTPAPAPSKQVPCKFTGPKAAAPARFPTAEEKHAMTMPINQTERLLQFLQATPEMQAEIDQVLAGKLKAKAETTTGPLLYGMTPAAKLLGVSRATLWRIIKAGRLSKVEVLPGSYRIRRVDLEALVAAKAPAFDKSTSFHDEVPQ